MSTKPSGAAPLVPQPLPHQVEMALGASVAAPDGFVELCARSPIDCVSEDTPQARALAYLSAREISKDRWVRAFALAQNRTVAPALTTASVTTASLGPQPSTAITQASAAAPAAAFTPISLGTQPLFDAAPQYEQVVVDPARWTIINGVNHFVNHAIHKRSDQEVYGVPDWWVAPLSNGLAPYGDCEDYALEKRRELIAAGVPARTLSIALVRTRWGEDHALLVVATEHGDLALDSLTDRILPWDRTPYEWNARQAPANPMVWLSVRKPASTSPFTLRTTIAAAGPITVAMH